jgi:hypothetical protein
VGSLEAARAGRTVVVTADSGGMLLRLAKQARHVPPIHQPEVAARTVLYAADQSRRRKHWVGVSTLAAGAIAPGLLDRYRPRRLRFAAHRGCPAARSADQPMGIRRRQQWRRLRRSRHFRQPIHGPQSSAVGLRTPRPECRCGRGSCSTVPRMAPVTADPTGIANKLA